MPRTTQSEANARVRAAARLALERVRAAERPPASEAEPLVLLALSGGADSLALAAATAPEASRSGVRAGAVIVDHGLQEGSAAVAAQAADEACGLGLEPVLVRRVQRVRKRADAAGGLEAAARLARYEALAEAARELGAHWILTAHTRDDQAEQTFLALARGSGVRSLAGIPPERLLDGGVTVLRPFLAERVGIGRKETEALCAELGLEPWRDPHNEDPAFARVRVRSRVLPMLERELGPGVASALARTADLAREDADALDSIAGEAAEQLLRGEEQGAADTDPASAPDPSASALVRIPAGELAALPASVRNRVIRRIAAERFGAHLSREHTLAVAALVAAWRGQGPIFVPGIRATRSSGVLILAPQIGSPRDANA